MSARSYLSIGDVLTLLRQEFPDITISKIRFLESQGLVNPERTPSGYRKFYEHDVERLRWVLRQQREHFLPLKVIKDRLDEDASIVHANGDGTASEDAEGREPVLAGRAAAPAAPAVGARAAEPADPAPTVATVPATAPPSAGGAPSVGTGTHAAPVATPSGDERSLPGLDEGPTGPSASEGAPPPRPAPPRTAGSGTGTRPAAPEPRSAPSATAGSPTAAASSAGEGGTTPVPTAASTRSSGSATADGGVRLSGDELASAAGLDAADVTSLVEFGLLTPTLVAGLATYDEHALAVAQAAASFARFGIEPRHLRLYKVAADREAGFIEQIVVPLVRQRNPEARVRAEATASELAELGHRLRAALLEVVLGPTLRG